MHNWFLVQEIARLEQNRLENLARNYWRTNHLKKRNSENKFMSWLGGYSATRLKK